VKKCVAKKPSYLALLESVDHLAVFLFLNGDVGHGCGSRGTMAVVLAGREPNDIARPDLLDGAALSLHPAAAGRYNVSVRANTWLTD
jgi:hypothetical protein